MNASRLFLTPSLTNGAIGGGLIGLAAAGLLVTNGDIMGASGIVHSVTAKKLQPQWKYAFLAGMFATSLSSEAASVYLVNNNLVLGLAGLLVGLGTKLANGCTSGHGICGLARLSKRSLASVGTFMGFGMLTSTLMTPTLAPVAAASARPQQAVTALLATLAIVAPFMKKQESKKLVPAVICGGLFTKGLQVSGMSDPRKVLGFLKISTSWDPTLAAVMAGGLLVSGLSYYAKSRMTAPVCSDAFDVPTNTVIDKRLIAGSALFGIGWGLGGICPGPAIVAAGSLLTTWWPGFMVGSLVGRNVKW